jgi:hypothetical protein
MKPKNVTQYIFLTVFFILMWLPLLTTNWSTQSTISVNENRVLSSIPPLNIRRPGDFIRGFEKYFNDNFGFRSELVNLNTVASLKFYNKSPVESVIIGKDGWLYYTPGVGDISVRPPYTVVNLEEMRAAIEGEKNFLKEHGINFISIIAPDKHSIYPEHLPNALIGQKINPRLFQRQSYFQNKVTFADIYLHSLLLKAKNNRQLYYKSDTHWNAHASFVAYTEIIKSIKDLYPQLIPLSEADFQIREIKKDKKGDLAIALGTIKTSEDVDVIYTLKPQAKSKLNADTKISKLVIYHDSFFDPVYPWGTIRFLKLHFDEVMLLPAHTAFDNDRILKEKPDLVIYQLVERSI